MELSATTFRSQFALCNTTQLNPSNQQLNMTSSYYSDIVALKNRQSGMVLDHYAGKRVEAFNMHTSNRNHQWHRIPLASGYCVYTNVGTGYLLGHYVGEPMRAHDLDVSNANCQWLELRVDDGDTTGFVALQNRATGMVLDHYREQSIQAYNGESDRLSQHWQLVSVHSTRRQQQQAAVGVGDLEQYDIVAFKNRETGKIVDHYAGERIEAYTNAVTHHNHKWYRIPIMGNNGSCFAYKNFYTGKVLEHYCGESVQAFTTITHLASHQWWEVDSGDEGFITLQNCASGKKLHHCHEKSIQACQDDGEGAHKDKTFQWELVWMRR